MLVMAAIFTASPLLVVGSSLMPVRVTGVAVSAGASLTAVTLKVKIVSPVLLPPSVAVKLKLSLVVSSPEWV